MKQYSIREVSDLFHLPASTLRYYEEMGILTNVARTPAGQRIYDDRHISRLRIICCFKKTGMTIEQLKRFFAYESGESEHIGDILSLLKEQEASVLEDMRQLQEAHTHIRRKLAYYSDIQRSLERGEPLPKWEDYKKLSFPVYP